MVLFVSLICLFLIMFNAFNASYFEILAERSKTKYKKRYYHKWAIRFMILCILMLLIYILALFTLVD